MAICGIYAIYDAKTNECLYVGQSKDVHMRWEQHVNRMRRGYGLEAFIKWFAQHSYDKSALRFVLLEECANDDGIKNSLEMKWFKRLKPRFFGKEPSPNERWEMSEETRAAIAEGLYWNLKRWQGATFIGDKEVVGIRKNQQYTSKEIVEVTCARCGKAFYLVADIVNAGKNLCRKCRGDVHARGEENSKFKDFPADDGTLLTKEQFKHEYFDLGMSTCDIARYHNTFDVSIINHANTWGVQLRNRDEALAVAAARRHKERLDAIDFRQFSYLWNLGVSIVTLQKVFGLGASLLKDYVAMHNLTRPHIRSKNVYPPYSPQIEEELLLLGILPDVLPLIEQDMSTRT